MAFDPPRRIVVSKRKQTQGVIDLIGWFLISFVFETIKIKKPRTFPWKRLRLPIINTRCLYVRIRTVFFLHKPFQCTAILLYDGWLQTLSTPKRQKHCYLYVSLNKPLHRPYWFDCWFDYIYKRYVKHSTRVCVCVWTHTFQDTSVYFSLWRKIILKKQRLLDSTSEKFWKGLIYLQ